MTLDTLQYLQCQFVHSIKIIILCSSRVEKDLAQGKAVYVVKLPPVVYWSYVYSSMMNVILIYIQYMYIHAVLVYLFMYYIVNIPYCSISFFTIVAVLFLILGHLECKYCAISGVDRTSSYTESIQCPGCYHVLYTIGCFLCARVTSVGRCFFSALWVRRWSTLVPTLNQFVSVRMRRCSRPSLPRKKWLLGWFKLLYIRLVWLHCASVFTFLCVHSLNID